MSTAQAQAPTNDPGFVDTTEAKLERLESDRARRAEAKRKRQALKRARRSSQS